MINKELKQTQISQTAIFTTGSMRASKIFPSFFLVTCIFFSDFFLNYSKDIKVFFLKASQPITEIPSAIGQIYSRATFFFSSQNQLFVEIETLRTEIEELNFELLKMKSIQNENDELSQLLNYSKKGKFTFSMLGEIKSKSFFPNESLNIETDIKKLNDNMIVINRKGVVGQIKEVFPKSVKVFPIYAKGNIVPAYINSNGLNIILKGLGEDKLFSIENLSSDVDLKIGDEIFSSGLGGKFPKGYLIGKIKKISNNPNLKFQTVEVQSTAVFNNGSKVLFISP